VRRVPRRAAARVERERLTTLARRLAEATSQRAAEWQLREPDVYAWSSIEGSVSIASRELDGEAAYELFVYNPEHAQVDELSSAVDGDGAASWNAPLAELHRVARRSALRADDVIDALIDALPSPAERAEPTATS
jgi:hypothetical protein